ncbi:MAG: hypothetical protein WC602_05400 [archaeon]
MSAEFDWAFASIIFVSAVTVMFIALPAFIPKVQPYDQGQYDAAFSQIVLSVQKQDVMLQADCNASEYDCSQNYSIKLDSNDMNVYFNNPAIQYGSEVVSYGKLNTPYSAYLNNEGIIDANFPITGLSYSLNSGVFSSASASGVDLNQSQSVLSAKFRGSGQPFDVRATFSKRNSLSLGESNSFLASAIDSASTAAVRAFGLIPEFWVELPADQNLNIALGQKAWKAGANSGLIASSAEWWDSNILDSVTWSYRIPFTVFSSIDRNTGVIEADFNFRSALASIGNSGALDQNSIRAVEYSGGSCVNHTNDQNECDSMPLYFSYSSSIGIGTLDFNLLTAMDANSTRQFALYFDTNANSTGTKQSASSSAVIYSAPQISVSIVVLQPQSGANGRVLVTNAITLFDPATIQVSFDTGVKKRWESSALTYRIPLMFDAGNYARTDTNLSTDVNFASAFSQANCAGCVLDQNSVSFVEVNNAYDAKAVSLPAYSFNYSSGTKTATVSWLSSGTLGAKAKRYYMIYFKNA